MAMGGGAKRKTSKIISLRLASSLDRRRAEALAVARGLDETARLAEARGEEVALVGGRLRISSRDGLRNLLESGAMQPPEYEAGLLYRAAFEALTAGPRSNLNREIGGGGDGYAELRAVRADRLEKWEALATTPRQRWVLRLVAGQGRTIRSLGSSGSAKLVNTRALAEVLRAIAIERGVRR